MRNQAERLRDSCMCFIRELTRLSQLNRPLSIDEFYEWSENEEFIHKIFEKYGSYIIGLHWLDPSHEHQDKESISYIENALGRHVNVITAGTYGVVDDAYLLAINVLVAISREADSM